MHKLTQLAGMLIFCLLSLLSNAQSGGDAHIVSIGSNAVSMPAIKFSPVHPLFQVGFSKVWKEKKFSLVQNFRAGYLYQRLAHHAIPVYTQIGYRYKFKFGLGVEAFLDAGYVHTFSDVQVYKLDDNGEYKRTSRAGKAHAMFGYSVVLSYKLKGKKVQFTPFVQHQFWMMTPFVKSYVPLLPNSAIQFGTYFTINRPAK